MLNEHRFPAVETDRIRVHQPLGGGPEGRPNLLWIGEVEVYDK